jgi:hypothetical protein
VALTGAIARAAPIAGAEVVTAVAGWPGITKGAAPLGHEVKKAG